MIRLEMFNRFCQNCKFHDCLDTITDIKQCEECKHRIPEQNKPKGICACLAKPSDNEKLYCKYFEQKEREK